MTAEAAGAAGQIYVIPAILGCLALLALAVDFVKSFQAVVVPESSAPRRVEAASMMRASPATAH